MSGARTAAYSIVLPRVARTCFVIAVLASVAPARVRAQSETGADVPNSTVLYSDQFNDADAGQLPQQSTDHYQLSYDTDNAEYVVETTDPAWHRIAQAHMPAQYGDSSLSVDVRLVGDVVNQYIAFGCREQSGTHYRFSLDPHLRRFRLSRWDTSHSSVALVEWKTSTDVLLDDATNHVEFNCAGPVISAYVNGARLAVINDGTYTSGSSWIGAGVFADKQGVVQARFSNLQILQMPAQSISEADIAARVGPSVVQVLTNAGEGSGVKIDAGILTNAHVVQDARQIEVATNDRRRAPAKIMRIDANGDLALLQTDLTLPSLEMEFLGQQRQGEQVLVFGYPLGVREGGGQATLTRGVISATGKYPKTGQAIILTDAAINRGNSGGAMVNMRAKLVGIPAYGLRAEGAQGMNFAIAMDTVNAFLAMPQNLVAVLP